MNHENQARLDIYAQPVEVSPVEKAWRKKSMRESRVAELAEALLKASFGGQQYPQSAQSCIWSAEQLIDALEQRRETLAAELEVALKEASDGTD